MSYPLIEEYLRKGSTLVFLETVEICITYKLNSDICMNNTFVIFYKSKCYFGTNFYDWIIHWMFWLPDDLTGYFQYSLQNKFIKFVKKPGQSWRRLIFSVVGISVKSRDFRLPTPCIWGLYAAVQEEFLDSLDLENGTDILSLNIGDQPQSYAT